jgi:hypothetical protein
MGSIDSEIALTKLPLNIRFLRIDINSVEEDEEEMERYVFPLANNVNTDGIQALCVNIPEWQHNI